MYKKGVQILSSVLFICMLLSGCGSKPTTEVTTAPTLENFNNEIVVSSTDVESDKSISNSVESDTTDINDSEDITQGDLSQITVKFIDVGQADSCLIVTANNDAILIDAGESSDASEILDVLNAFGLEDIDLMVLTHPHKDHIGGAKTILENYKVEEVLMSSYVTNTKVFENLLDTMESQDLLVTQATVGKEYNIDGLEITVVGVDSVNNNNDSSVVLKITYGTVDMLFTGDAEEGAEKVILQNGFDLSAEILKVGHHGSDTSTSVSFLDAISPKLAVISCGAGNKYGHPADITLEKFKDRNITYYRTDEFGTITLEIDGENIITSFEDSFEMQNAKMGTFLYAPNVAEVELEVEEKVVEQFSQNNK